MGRIPHARVTREARHFRAAVLEGRESVRAKVENGIIDVANVYARGWLPSEGEGEGARARAVTGRRQVFQFPGLGNSKAAVIILLGAGAACPQR